MPINTYSNNNVVINEPRFAGERKPNAAKISVSIHIANTFTLLKCNGILQTVSIRANSQSLEIWTERRNLENIKCGGFFVPKSFMEISILRNPGMFREHDFQTNFKWKSLQK